MTAKPYKTDDQIKATVSRLVNGDGYRRRITKRPPYFVLFFLKWIEVEHEEYVGAEEVKAHDDDIAQREFKSRYFLKSFTFLKDRGFAFTLSSGGSLDMATDKVSIEFRPRLFTSDRMMPDIDIVWQGVGKRSGPFKSIVEKHVTLTFRNRAHMDRFFKGGTHMPKALRHEGSVYLRRDDAYYDNSGSMLPVWIMLFYMMSNNDREAFANNNAALSGSIPNDSAIQQCVVTHDDEDYKAAVSPTDSGSADDAGNTGGDRSDAAQPDQAAPQQDDTPAQQDSTPTVDSSPAMDSSAMSTGTE
jgi:hypothetical protein